MKRWLFNLGSGLSLAMLLLCTVFWVFSYRWSVYVGLESSISTDMVRWGGTSEAAWGRAHFEIWRRQHATVSTQEGWSRSHSWGWGPLKPGQQVARERYLDSLGGQRLPGFYWLREEMNAWPGGTNPNGKKPIIPQTLWILELSFGWLTVLFLPLPVWWIAGWRSRRRQQRLLLGQCVGCGYDLRGSSGRSACPECGVERQEGSYSRPT